MNIVQSLYDNMVSRYDKLLQSGCSKVQWKFPEETGFSQPIVIAR